MSAYLRRMRGADGRAIGRERSSFEVHRSSSAKRMASNRWRSATTVGWRPRDWNHARICRSRRRDGFRARDFAGTAARDFFTTVACRSVVSVEKHCSISPAAGLQSRRKRDIDDEKRTAEQ